MDDDNNIAEESKKCILEILETVAKDNEEGEEEEGEEGEILEEGEIDDDDENDVDQEIMGSGGNKMTVPSKSAPAPASVSVSTAECNAAPAVHQSASGPMSKFGGSHGPGPPGGRFGGRAGNLSHAMGGGGGGGGGGGVGESNATFGLGDGLMHYHPQNPMMDPSMMVIPPGAKSATSYLADQYPEYRPKLSTSSTIFRADPSKLKKAAAATPSNVGKTDSKTGGGQTTTTSAGKNRNENKNRQWDRGGGPPGGGGFGKQRGRKRSGDPKRPNISDNEDSFDSTGAKRTRLLSPSTRENTNTSNSDSSNVMTTTIASDGASKANVSSGFSPISAPPGPSSSSFALHHQQQPLQQQQQQPQGSESSDEDDDEKQMEKVLELMENDLKNSVMGQMFEGLDASKRREMLMMMLKANPEMMEKSKQLLNKMKEESRRVGGKERHDSGNSTTNNNRNNNKSRMNSRDLMGRGMGKKRKAGRSGSMDQDVNSTMNGQKFPGVSAAVSDQIAAIQQQVNNHGFDGNQSRSSPLMMTGSSDNYNSPVNSYSNVSGFAAPPGQASQTQGGGGGGAMRRRDLCKFYLQGFCQKGDQCNFMHSEFPCKFFHTGVECYSGPNCRFSHEPLTDETRAILKQHLDSGTLPDEELGRDSNNIMHSSNNQDQQMFDSHQPQHQQSPISNQGQFPGSISQQVAQQSPGGGSGATVSSGQPYRPMKPVAKRWAILGDPTMEMKTSYYTWEWQQELKELEMAYTGTKRNLFCIEPQFVVKEKPPTPPPEDEEEKEAAIFIAQIQAKMLMEKQEEERRRQEQEELIQRMQQAGGVQDMSASQQSGFAPSFYVDRMSSGSPHHQQQQQQQHLFMDNQNRGSPMMFDQQRARADDERRIMESGGREEYFRREASSFGFNSPHQSQQQPMSGFGFGGGGGPHPPVGFDSGIAMDIRDPRNSMAPQSMNQLNSERGSGFVPGGGIPDNLPKAALDLLYKLKNKPSRTPNYDEDSQAALEESDLMDNILMAQNIRNEAGGGGFDHDSDDDDEAIDDDSELLKRIKRKQIGASQGMLDEARSSPSLLGAGDGSSPKKSSININKILSMIRNTSSSSGGAVATTTSNSDSTTTITTSSSSISDPGKFWQSIITSGTTTAPSLSSITSPSASSTSHPKSSPSSHRDPRIKRSSSKSEVGGGESSSRSPGRASKDMSGSSSSRRKSSSESDPNYKLMAIDLKPIDYNCYLSGYQNDSKLKNDPRLQKYFAKMPAGLLDRMGGSAMLPPLSL